MSLTLSSLQQHTATCTYLKHVALLRRFSRCGVVDVTPFEFGVLLMTVQRNSAMHATRCAGTDVVLAVEPVLCDAMMLKAVIEAHYHDADPAG